MWGTRRQQTSLLAGLLPVLFLAAALPGSACAQDASAPAVRAAGPTQTPGREQRRRVAEAAGHLVLLLALTGALSLALLVLWGFRVRRQIRRPLPHVTATDDLWYLRPDKSRSTTPPASDAPKDHRRP